MMQEGFNFNINQENDGYRHSEEPFLLTKFVSDVLNCERLKNIIDLGTGCGAIPILLSKCCKNAKFLGVDIEKSSTEIAWENVVSNNLEEKINIEEIDICKLPEFKRKGSYDLVISNPPYRKVNAGRLSPNKSRLIARHEVKVTLKGLIKVSETLLKVNGSLVLSHIPDRLDEVIIAMINAGIKPRYLQFVHFKSGYNASIVLLEGVKRGKHNMVCLPPVILNG